MKSPVTLIAAAIALFALTGCAASNSGVNISDDLRKKCQRPIAIPDKRMTAIELERYYATDRAALADCADLNEAIIGSVDAHERIKK